MAAAPATPEEPLAPTAQPVREPAAEAAPAQIDALIEDLADPQARAELISDLEALREARANADAAGQTLQNFDLSRLIGAIGNRLRGLWQQLLETDTEWLLQRLLLSVLVILLAVVIHRLVRRGTRRLRARLERFGPEHVARRGIRVGERIILITLIVAALAAVLELWGVSLVQWVTAVTRFEWLRTSFAVVVIGAAAMLLLSVCDTGIAGAMSRQASRLKDAGHRTRLRTITPLLQGLARITIGVLAVLLILAELGVNVGPMLAGAGIVGLAIGFAAQSLIKDLLVGLNLLWEHAVAVGDVVDAGGKAGEVEEMGLRLLRLRDLEGTVHFIPYSEIRVISNLTKDYAFALLDVRVAYRESVDDVIDILADTAENLRTDQDLGPLILDHLEVLGVDALTDSAVVVRVRVKTVALERWRIARELRKRIKSRFDEAGIEIPFPPRTVYFGAGKEGQAPPMRPG